MWNKTTANVSQQREKNQGLRVNAHHHIRVEGKKGNPAREAAVWWLSCSELNGHRVCMFKSWVSFWHVRSMPVVWKCSFLSTPFTNFVPVTVTRHIHETPRIQYPTQPMWSEMTEGPHVAGLNKSPWGLAINLCEKPGKWKLVLLSQSLIVYLCGSFVINAVKKRMTCSLIWR